jgi:Na+-translocating ferredoxin:NAD+ oxidoreductase RnfD subunit
MLPSDGSARRRDPRLYQISVLASLLVYGLTRLHFEIGALQAAVTLAAALLAQAAGDRLTGRRYEPRSALISGLSLCLLLRTDHVVWAALAAAIAVGSKFLVRFRGKHLFNPTNVALVALILATDRVWVSPGQWGNAAFFAFLMACLGGLVVNRASRSDVTYAFLASYVAIQFGYAAWLGQPWATPLHRMENGALLLFAFFMISDPRTTPDSRAGRVLFAVLVAAGAAFVQFVLYRTNGLLWSLALFSLTTPLIDRLLPGPRYAWPGSPQPGSSRGGHSHEPSVPEPRLALAGARAAGAAAQLRP